jgi:hypothetical protein
MAFNADAIRKKLADLSGKNSKKNILWRPEEGKNYQVRFLPFTDGDGTPFKELWFYYNIGENSGLLTPHQFGKPDPIQELINKLRSDESKDSYELAKKLYPKMRTFGAVVVRGEEDKGVRIWSFGKMVYQDLLNIMLDSDYGDIADVKRGYDIKVRCEKLPGKQFADTTVTPKPQHSALSDDQSTSRKWLDSIPSLDDLYALKSYDELSKIVNDWIGGGSPSSEGTTRGPSAVDVDEDAPKASKRKIDDAFAELDDL